MTGRDITAVVFDIGGVLLDWDPRHLYRQLFEDPAEMTDFLHRICTPQWHRSHDLGADTEQSCRDLARVHPDHAELIMAWAHRGEEMIRGQIDETVGVLAELAAAGVRCLALSNMEMEKFALRRSRFPFFDWFDGCVISGIEGVAKPDRGIFEILVSRYSLTPETTVFIDDSERNVIAAGRLGLIAIRYSTAAALRRDLSDLGLTGRAGSGPLDGAGPPDGAGEAPAGPRWHLSPGLVPPGLPRPGAISSDRP
jgi:2-haloacid dehalogenase